MLEALKFLQQFKHSLQSFQNMPPDFAGLSYLYKKQFRFLFFHIFYHDCPGSKIILSMFSIFFSISSMVLFHIDTSASSWFRRSCMLFNVPLISPSFPFTISNTSKISL